MTDHQRTCACCATTPRTFVTWWIDRDTGEQRMLCLVCVGKGWYFAESGLPRQAAARAVDGGTRRAVAGLLRGSVGTRKGEHHGG